MDYYAILEIDKNASEEDIKKAYRRLAKKYHPDLNQGNPEAESKFKALSEAYETLSDPDKKSHYDRFGTNSGQHHDSGFNPFGGHGFDPSSFFADFFGGNQKRQRVTNSDIETQVTLSFGELLLGCVKKIKINKSIFCEDCNGVGGFNASACLACNGSGHQVRHIQQGFMVMHQTVPCTVCQAKGKTFEKICSECTNGIKIVNEEIDLKIPQNCPVFSRLSAHGKGNQENKNLPPGNLNIFLQSATPEFEVDREGNVIHHTNITLKDWYNNNTVNLNRFDVEYLSYNLRNLERSDKSVIFSGKGLRSSDNNKQGDYIVFFKISK
jgi:molecular chaperone DnaJ